MLYWTWRPLLGPSSTFAAPLVLFVKRFMDYSLSSLSLTKFHNSCSLWRRTNKNKQTKYGCSLFTFARKLSRITNIFQDFVEQTSGFSLICFCFELQFSWSLPHTQRFWIRQLQCIPHMVTVFTKPSGNGLVVLRGQSNP